VHTPSHQPDPERPDRAHNIAILPAIGVFKGISASNREHRHWAHQLSIGLDDEIEVISKGIGHRASALFILAGTPHRLVANSVLSIYLDPPSDMAHAVRSRIYCDGPIVALPERLATMISGLFEDAKPVGHGLEKFMKSFQVSAPHSLPRKLQTVLEILNRGIRAAHGTDRACLAKIAGLSESRFSHWFREETGLPLRSYRKWLRLIFGLEQALKGSTLTNAAHGAEFSDQAHFSRTFVQMFGVRPSDVVGSAMPKNADGRD
jgi:AraC-like DNA-binding protein